MASRPEWPVMGRGPCITAGKTKVNLTHPKSRSMCSPKILVVFQGTGKNACLVNGGIHCPSEMNDVSDRPVKLKLPFMALRRLPEMAFQIKHAITGAQVDSSQQQHNQNKRHNDLLITSEYPVRLGKRQAGAIVGQDGRQKESRQTPQNHTTTVTANAEKAFKKEVLRAFHRTSTLTPEGPELSTASSIYNWSTREMRKEMLILCSSACGNITEDPLSFSEWFLSRIKEYISATGSSVNVQVGSVAANSTEIFMEWLKTTSGTKPGAAMTAKASAAAAAHAAPASAGGKLARERDGGGGSGGRSVGGAAGGAAAAAVTPPGSGGGDGGEGGGSLLLPANAGREAPASAKPSGAVAAGSCEARTGGGGGVGGGGDGGGGGGGFDVSGGGGGSGGGGRSTIGGADAAAVAPPGGGGGGGAAAAAAPPGGGGGAPPSSTRRPQPEAAAVATGTEVESNGFAGASVTGSEASTVSAAVPMAGISVTAGNHDEREGEGGGGGREMDRWRRKGRNEIMIMVQSAGLVTPAPPASWCRGGRPTQPRPEPARM